MRKKIMKWLLGNDWEEYWDLHKRYCERITKNISLMNELIEKIEKEKETVEISLRICNLNEKLISICEKYNIDVDKELELID